MTNDQPSRRPPARSSGGGAPMGSTVSIVIAVVAVVVGFLILRNISNDDDTAAGGETPSTESTAVNPDESTTTTTTLPSTPTTRPLTLTGATVVVANASGQGGAAGNYTKALESVGFTMGTATDAAGPEQRIDISKVYYLPGGEEVAISVAQVMSTPDSVVITAPMPTPVPVEGEAAGIGDATVLVMLGTDRAGKALPALAPTEETTLPTAPLNTSTTVA